MADIEAIEVLTQAKERLFEQGWRNFADERVAEEICLGQALAGHDGWYCMSERTDATGRSNKYLEQAIGLPNKDASYIWSWNDCQASAGPVFDAIYRAIEIAKEAPNPHVEVTA